MKKKQAENEVDIVLNTEDLTLYRILTENAAKYYGFNTKWCIAADKDNNFTYYNSFGNIYIIILKKNIPPYKKKYSFHYFKSSRV